VVAQYGWIVGRADDVRRKVYSLSIARGQKPAVCFKDAALLHVVLWIVRRTADGGNADHLPPELAQAFLHRLPSRGQSRSWCIVGAPTEDDIAQHHSDVGLLCQVEKVLAAHGRIDHGVRATAGECLGTEIEHDVMSRVHRVMRAVQVGVDAIQGAPQEPKRFRCQGAATVEAMHQVLVRLQGLSSGCRSG
jgi:hypothetical protein